MMPSSRLLARVASYVIAAAAALLCAAAAQAGSALLNVSYDPTRELYNAINPAFDAEWKAKTGETVQIQASHGGSGPQARALTDGRLSTGTSRLDSPPC